MANRHPANRRPTVYRLAAGLLALGSAVAAVTARAGDFIVYSPYVTQGRSELEFRGSRFQDSDPAVSGSGSYAFSFAHGVTNWWKPEVYFAEYDREPGGSTKLSGYEFENTFQLAPQGKYWADPGFLFSYEHVKAAGEPNVVEFGPLLEKRSGRFDHRLNFIWEKQVGGGASSKYEFRAAYAVDYRVRTAFRPGLEAYYRPDDDASHLGPVVNGEIYDTSGHEFGYSVGVLFGTTSSSPNETYVARLEYEF